MPIIDVVIDASGAKKGLADYKKAVDSADKQTSGFTSRANSYYSTMAGVISTVAGSAFVALGAKAIDAASDMQETQGKFDVVFRGLEDSAESWATSLQSSYGMSSQEAKKFLASTQDLLVPMGMVRGEAGKMSNEVVKLATDLGSFNNIDTAQVMDDMQSALVGNYETMKKYGVVLSAARVEQEAYRLGLATSKADLDASAKAQAAYSLMVKGSSDAVGDFNRTSGSFANQMKTAKAHLKDFAVTVGEQLLPYATEAITAFNKWAVEGNGLNKTMGFLVDGARALYNGFEGVNLILHGAVVVVAALFEGITQLLTPFEMFLAGLQAIGAIDTNPLADLSAIADDFYASSIDGFSGVVDGIESTNAGFDRLKEKIGETSEAHATAAAQAVAEQKEYKTAVEDVTAAINQEWEASRQAQQSDTSKVISALKGESDQLVKTAAGWINVKDSASEYGRVVASSVAPNIDIVTGAEQQKTTATEAATTAAIAHADALQSEATAADATTAALEASASAESSSSKSYSFSGAPSDAEGLLALATSKQDVWDNVTSPSAQRGSDWSVWSESAASNQTGNHQKYMANLREMYLDAGGSSQEWTAAVNGGTTVNNYFTQSVTKTDVAEIAAESARSEARA